MKVEEVRDRVWTFYQNHLQKLQYSGFSDLPKTKPNVTVRNVVKRIQPQKLKSDTKNIL